MLNERKKGSAKGKGERKRGKEKGKGRNKKVKGKIKGRKKRGEWVNGEGREEKKE